MIYFTKDSPLVEIVDEQVPSGFYKIIKREDFSPGYPLSFAIVEGINDDGDVVIVVGPNRATREEEENDEQRSDRFILRLVE